MYWNVTIAGVPKGTLELTLTWDVLKFCCSVTLYNTAPELTLTWDVLKFTHINNTIPIIID